MKRAFLGDSYDAVKRMWQEMLASWAPLYAEPRFIPDDLQQEFTRLTKIPIFSGRPSMPFAILNDPDTGIRLPGEQNQKEGRSHITIETIVGQLRQGAQCIITFDQSDYRQSNLSLDEQHQTKLRFLARKGGHGFYYVSHAPFLFAVPNAIALGQIQKILRDAGLPGNRLTDHRNNAEV
jgi:hypothetical protein